MYFLIPVGHEESDVRRVPWVSAAIIVLCILVHWRITLPENEKLQTMLHALGESIDYYAEHPYLEPSPEFVSELKGYGIDLEAEDEGQVLGQLDPPGSGRFGPSATREPSQDPWGADEEEEDSDPADAPSYAYRGAAPGPAQNHAQEQRQFDDLFAEFQRIKAENGERLGLIPAQFELMDLVAAIFLHASWWHLLSNLFIFWLCAPSLEDIWGRPFFAFFFLMAGILSGLAWYLLNRDSTIPMVGASGAIAGLMGAFALRFWHSRINFFYAFFWLLPPMARTGTFTLPASVTLGFWFGRELLSLAVTEWAGIQAGVAFAAHVGGFVAGSMGAWLIAKQGIEKRFLAPAIERKLDQQLGALSNVELAKAVEHIEQGRHEDAWILLQQTLQKRPNDLDTATALWDLAVKIDRRPQALAPVLRQLKHELRGGDRMLAVQRWFELAEFVPLDKLEIDFKWRLVEALAGEEMLPEARSLLDTLSAEMVAPLQVGVKMKLLKVATDSGSTLTLPLAQQCAALPDLPEAVRAQLAEAILRGQQIVVEDRERKSRLGHVEVIPLAPLRPASQPTLPPLPPVGAAPVLATEISLRKEGITLKDEVPAVLPSLPAIPLPVAPQPLRVLDVVPLRFKDSRLEVQGGKGNYVMTLTTLNAIAVARIDEHPQSWLVIDLFLDFPGAAGSRVARLRSNNFDPRRELVPNQPDAFTAYMTFIQELLQKSGVRPLPSAAATAGAPFARFTSVAEYEAEIRRY